MSNFYEILNTNINSSDEEIKKSFRKLSLQNHPDKTDGSTTELYNNILNAYKTLGDKELRRLYNLSLNKNEGAIVISERQTTTTVIPCIKTCKLEITMEQAYRGYECPMEIERIIYNHEGIKEKEVEKIYVNLYSGIDNNEIIIVKEKGDMLSNGTYGDIKILITVKEHDFFKRDGLNLYINKFITFKESICGFEYLFQNLDGTHIMVKSSKGEVVLNKSSKIIKNKGFTRNSDKGDIVIDFTVIKPNNISKDKILQLKKILF
jgi:DnaJ-class molecular chaperone